VSQETSLEELAARALAEIRAASTMDVLEAARVAWLGRKSELMARLKTLGSLDPEARRSVGARLNELKASIEEAVRGRGASLAEGSPASALDVTLPAPAAVRGSRHPIPLVMERIVDAFRGMGFEKAEGAEVVTEFDNFDFLNTAPDHPARDMQDTFYLGGSADRAGRRMLRSHTSAMWRSEMEHHEPPLRMVFPGRVYRRDPADATHSPVFHQVEGLWVDDACRFSDLKGVLSAFLRGFFGEDLGVRFEPRFFPFTEPSTEVSIECTSCRGKGCRACGRSGWLEILGAGMVHPSILARAGRGYAAAGVRGFAFGMGVERLAMLKYRMADMRWMYDNDLRVLAQVRG